MRNDPHGHALVHHHVDRRLEVIGIRAVVAFPDADAHREDRVGIVMDLGDPANLYYGESWALGTLLASSGNTTPGYGSMYSTHTALKFLSK